MVDATDPSGATMTGSMALNELSASTNQQAPIALVQPGNPMVLDGNGNYSIAKVNAYRMGINQPPLAPNDDPKAIDTAFCMNLLNIGAPFIQKYQKYFEPVNSPLPGIRIMKHSIEGRVTYLQTVGF